MASKVQLCPHHLFREISFLNTADPAIFGKDVNDFAKILMPFGACLSLICYAIIYYLYMVVKALKRQPTSMLILHKFALEGLFVVQYLWIGVVDFNQKDNSYYAFSSALTQFSLLGSELWIAALSFDLYISLRNPFDDWGDIRDTRSWAFISTVLIYSFSIFFAILLVAIPNEGSEVYGLSSEPMIWVRDLRCKYGDGSEARYNPYKSFYFYLWMGFIYLFALGVFLWAKFLKKYEQGLEKTLESRTESIGRLALYLFGYVLFWGVVFVCQVLVAFYSASNTSYVRLLWTILLSFRGVLALTLILYGHWKPIISTLHQRHPGFFVPERISSMASDLSEITRKEGRINLNETQNQARSLHSHDRDRARKSTGTRVREALRAEILYYTTKGICIAAKQHDLDRLNILRTSFGIGKEFVDSSQSVDTLQFSFRAITQSINMSHRVSSKDEPSPSDRSDSSPSRPSLNSASMMSQTFPLSHPSFSSSIRSSSLSSFISDRSSFIYNLSPRSSQTSHSMKSPLLSSETSQQFSNDPSHQLGLNDEDLKRIKSGDKDFSFVDFNTQIFAEIRSMCGISTEEYVSSFSSESMFEKSSEGKSRAFLYFSSDRRFIVKTTEYSELRKLMQMLPAYRDHLRANPRSYLSRFLSAHSITMYGIRLYFVVMNNICPDNVDQKYDLKGSWLARRAISSRGGVSGRFDRSVFFKDCDIQNRISLNPQDALGLAKIISRDVEFLKGFHIMDYSLLVLVKLQKYSVSMDQFAQISLRNSGNSGKESNELTRDQIREQEQQQLSHLGGLPQSLGAHIVEGPSSYYIGVIDFLSEWNYLKRIERFMKLLWNWSERDGISAMEPEAYARRFMERAVYDIFEGSRPQNQFHGPSNKFDQSKEIQSPILARLGNWMLSSESDSQVGWWDGLKRNPEEVEDASDDDEDGGLNII